MRDVVEAALTSQRHLDEARRERMGGDGPPCMVARSTALAGVLRVGPGSWLVGLVREVEVPYLTSKQQLEFVTWRVDRDGASYRAVEATSMAAAKTPLSPFLTRLNWWGVRLKYFLKRGAW